VEKGKVVVHLLFPTNQDAPEAVHPTMGSLTDPSSGPVARGFEFLFFFSAGLDVILVEE
jgi:hypothetical protein